jgi:hypothetical protein
VSIDDDLARWTYLAEQAKQGFLTLNPEAASAYAAACRTLIGGLASAQSNVKSAGNIGGLGQFRWADELRNGLKGVVDGSDNSVRDTLDKYMQVTQLMSDTVNAAVRTLTGQDADTAQHITDAGRT